MSKRVVAGIVAGMAGLLGAAVLVVPGVATGSGQLGSAAVDTVKEFSTRLSGAAEVPPADPDGSGSAAISIDTTTNEICWEVTVANIGTAVMAHIHEGAAGTNGPVRVNLFPPLPNPTSTGCVIDATYAPLIVANPAGFYVNVHTGDFPAGAIRGQLANSPQQTVLLPIPLRAYDSRTADGPLAAGQTLTIPLASGKDAAGASFLAVPPGATSAVVTLTVTQTVGAGFVTLYSAALTAAPSTSSINWSAPEQILSVSTPVAVDSQGRVKITGGVAATQVIIDVVGYTI